MNKLALGQDGFEMNYEVVPNVLPTDTLFIHGNMASNAWWRPSLEIWKSQAEPGYTGRAILAEWRGCGKSSPPKSEADLAIEGLADDYIELLSRLGIKRACLVGHSTGGLIGLIAVAKRPELFVSAFLLDPVSAEGRSFTPGILEAFERMSEDRQTCGEILGATIHGNDFSGSLFQGLLDDAFRISKHNWLGVPRALSRVNVKEKLREIKTPITVAHGEFDHVLPIAKSKAMANDLKNGTFLELKNQGHCMNVENPAAFVSLVNQALFTQRG